MPREIDEKKKRKALRKLRKAAERAEAEGGSGLSDWEREFVDEVEERVEKYGSAFADPEKGRLDEPLSAMQTRKLKEIDKKSRGKETGFKQRSGFKSKKKAAFTPRVRDINAEIEEETDMTPAPPPRPVHTKLPRLIKASDIVPKTPAPAKPALHAVPSISNAKPPTKSEPANKKPVFQVIKGGKDTG